MTVFKSILSQSRCSLEPKNFLRAFLPLKTLLGFWNTPRSPSSLDARYAHFSADYMHSWDHVWYLHVGHLIEENQLCISIFVKKNKLVQRMNDEICCITKEGEMAKNKWENDYDILPALCIAYKKIRTILFPCFTC